MGMDSNTANGGYDQSVDWVSMSLMSVEYPKGMFINFRIGRYLLVFCIGILADRDTHLTFYSISCGGLDIIKV